VINKVQNSPQSPQATKKSTDDTALIPEQFKNVARGMEEQFARYMLSEMEKTVIKDDESENNTAKDFYASMLDGERAQAMTKSRGGKGLGIQEMILDQIYPKRMRNELNLSKYKAKAMPPKGLERKGEI
jgi:Rod binding domain-containing protein